MTDSPTGPAEAAPEPAPKPAFTIPSIPRNTGSYFLLLIALGVAVWLQEKDLITRMINGLFDAGLLVWGTRQQSRGDAQ
jgi:hypothetical protein